MESTPPSLKLPSLLLGFDPGGAGAFGWCVCEFATNSPLTIRKVDVANNAEEAVAAALQLVKEGEIVQAAGIDAPLFWVPGGDRNADAVIRRAICDLGAPGGTERNRGRFTQAAQGTVLTASFPTIGSLLTIFFVLVQRECPRGADC